MREVIFYRGASPPGELEPHPVSVDDDGYIRSIDGFVIIYCSERPVHIDDPMPNCFPFCNSYRTADEARAAALSEYSQRAHAATERLGALTVSGEP